MLKFISKRLLILIPVLIGVSFLVFGIMSLMPADVASIQLGIAATPEGIEQWNIEHGLDRPFFTRYFHYMIGLFRGDFGKSYSTNMPVSTELGQRISTTLSLTIGTLIVIMAIGIPIGIISAIKQYSVFDTVSRVTAMLLTSVPAFWLGLILLLKFSVELGWVPSTGNGTFRSFILPWITLSAANAAQLIRMTRSTMLEVIRADYVQTARARVLDRCALFWSMSYAMHCFL